MDLKHRKIFLSVLAFLALAFVFVFVFTGGQGGWEVSVDGKLSYPVERGPVEYKVEILEENESFRLEKVVFKSRGAEIAGLLRVPISARQVPGLVLLPGAGVSKEGEQFLAGVLAERGYASLALDQRNRGSVDVQADFRLFKNGVEPVEHKMVYDALQAVDVLRNTSGVDPDKIAIIGESNGGRFAIIAAALDPKVRGVIGISTSGYNTREILAGTKDSDVVRFYTSIDPDTYLADLPPRRLVMIHWTKDKIIPLEAARKTFNKAHQPKSFYPVEGEGHGFNTNMTPSLERGLKEIFTS